MNRKTYRLEYLAAKGRSIISGPFGSSIGSRFFQSDGVPVIRGNNLTIDHKKFVEDGFVFVSHEKAEELNAYALRDDILFTAAGTIGQVGIIPRNSRFEKYVISNKQLRIRIDPEKADPDFVFYWLASPWIFRTIQNRNTGSTVPLINLGTIKGLPVVLPGGVKDQKKVSDLLGAIDAKIELNNRINAELEGMAKLLYDYWFVQFDFPMSAAQAAALGKPHLTGHPYRASGGKMIYNEPLKRDIPYGWKGGNILGVSDIGGGGTPSKAKPEYWSGDIPFFTPTDSTDTVFCLDTEDHITQQGLEGSSTKLYQPETIFITARGSVGRAMIASRPMAMNQSCYALVPKSGVSPAFLYFHTLSLMDYLHAKSSGSVFNSIVTNDLHFTPAVVPAPEQLAAFGKVVGPIFDAILTHQQQNQELTQLRDWLLPMLMNGQVTVISDQE